MKSHWRLLATPALDGAMNMAADVALLDRARATGESVFRVYSWSAPTLSLGRNQRAAGLYDEGALAARDIAVVRRPTGGRAIVHWREVTYSVTAPATGTESPGDAYAAINAVLLTALGRLGVRAHTAGRAAREHAPDALPCFAQPSAGEIVLLSGKKLVGSAQYTENGAMLQHGSILLEDDQSLLAGLTAVHSPPAAPATIAMALGEAVSPDAVRAALFDAVGAHLDPAAEILDARDVLLEAEQRAPFFRDPVWTWRR